jgi:hypothetical protein
VRTQGPSLGVLLRCERLRRGDRCFCRFAAADIADDLSEAGAPDVAEMLETNLEPEGVEELRGAVQEIDLDALDDAVAERLSILLGDLGRLVGAGAGLTDRYSDELD